MKLHITGVHYTPIQLKMPLEIERIIEVNDPVYTFHGKHQRNVKKEPAAGRLHVQDLV